MEEKPQQDHATTFLKFKYEERIEDFSFIQGLPSNTDLFVVLLITNKLRFLIKK